MASSICERWYVLFVTAMLVVIIAVPSINNATRSSTTDSIKEVKTDGPIYISHALSIDDVEYLKSAVGVYEEGKDYTIQVDGIVTGGIPPTEQEWDELPGSFNVVTDVINPPYNPQGFIDHSTEPFFPKIDAQGSLPCCGTWATVYYANGYQQAKDNNWTEASAGNPAQLLSVQWVYNKINQGLDKIIGGPEAVYVMQTLGSATQNYLPYDQFEWKDFGNESAWRSAPQFRMGDFDRTYTTDTSVMKAWLDEGYVLPTWLDTNGWAGGLGTDDDTVTAAEYNYVDTNHAVTIVGYNDSKIEDGEIGAFKFANSAGENWGSDWNGNGYFYMTYDAVAEIPNMATRFFDMENNSVKLLATWEFSTPPSRDCTITLGIGSYDSPLETRYMFLNSSGLDLYPDFMALDVTEFYDEWIAGESNFFIHIEDGTSAGTLSSFKIEENGEPYTPGSPMRVSENSPDTPSETACYANVTFTAIAPELSAGSAVITGIMIVSIVLIAPFFVIGKRRYSRK